jgi:FemAB-related protein (PEP-CTERM system-associated)
MNALSSIAGGAIRRISLSDDNEIARIEAFVRAQAKGTPFHLPRWGRAVELACGHEAILLVSETVSGDINGYLPLTVVHSPIFGRALVSAAFAVDGGILASTGKVAAQLTGQAVALAERYSCPTLELRGGMLPKTGWHCDETTYLGFARDLAEEDDAELLAIPRKQRAEVRKALDFGLAAEIGTSAKDRAAHYGVYAESVRNLGTPVFPRALFDAVLNAFGDEADILTVRHEGRALASVLSLYWRGTVMPYWGGGSMDARRWRANDMMYYALMLHARKQKGCRRFDFGRSKAGTGPAAFKRNWGFEGEPLSYAKLALDGGEIRDINPMSPKYRLQVSLWQKLPLSIANRIGPMIAKGLG